MTTYRINPHFTAKNFKRSQDLAMHLIYGRKLYGPLLVITMILIAVMSEFGFSILDMIIGIFIVVIQYFIASLIIAPWLTKDIMAIYESQSSQMEARIDDRGIDFENWNSRCFFDWTCFREIKADEDGILLLIDIRVLYFPVASFASEDELVEILAFILGNLSPDARKSAKISDGLRLKLDKAEHDPDFA